MMLPGKDLLMMRLKIHTSNVHIHEVYRIRLEKVIRAHTGPNRSLQHDSDGILLLRSVQRKKGEDKTSVHETMMSGTISEAPASKHLASSSNKPDQPSTFSSNGPQKVHKIIQKHSIVKVKKCESK